LVVCILQVMQTKQRLVLIVSILASVVSAIDGFIVNVALPTISREVGGGLVTQQWTVDAYLVTLGALILIAGSLSDLLGRKRVLMVGLSWFGVASLLCALAPSGPLLIIARALQGVGGALLVPSSLALIIATFSGKEQSHAIGTWTAWLSTATIVGPLFGGLILAVASWRWIFAVNVLPIAVTMLLLRHVTVAEHKQPGTRIDVLGAILCAGGLGALVFGLIEQPKYGWSDVMVASASILGLVLLTAFVLHERRTPAPMLPLALLRSRNFAVGNVATFAIYAGLSVSSFLITITLQQVGGYSPLAASLAMLPVSIIMFLLSSRFGALAGRFGPRLFMALGPIVAALGFLLMLRLQPQVHYWADVLPGVLVFGLGLSLTVAPLTSAVLGGVEARNAGVGSAINNAVARIAGLVAVALAGIVTGPHLDIAGFHRALIAVSVLMAIGGLVSAVGIVNSQPPQSAT
jgi:EmrB/QacA subfamily drug resistance transporter